MSINGRQNEYRCKADIVRGLLYRELQGRSLRTRGVKAEDRPLYVAAIRHYRIWGNALRAAGVHIESVSGRRLWSPERVITRIQKLYGHGVALNYKSVYKIDSGLCLTARRFWGSWDLALDAAGFDPTQIRRLRPPWTKAGLIEAIRSHAVSGGCVTRNAMRPHSIGKAADRLFGSFDAALEAAGVAQLRPPHPRWSRTKVEASIKHRAQMGLPVNCVAVIQADPCLYDAARNYHGGWNQALRAAGIDPNRVRAIRRQWTTQDVLEELRRRVATGVQPTCVSSIRPITLVTACRKLFGSVEKAVLAAGVEPAQIGYVRSPQNELRRTRRKRSRKTAGKSRPTRSK